MLFMMEYYFFMNNIILHNRIPILFHEGRRGFESTHKPFWLKKLPFGIICHIFLNLMISVHLISFLLLYHSYFFMGGVIF